jgi:predicted nucleic acid-binding protein
LRPPVLLDTGPLVALLNRREKLHTRVKAVLPLLPSPLLTVEPVLTEAMHLLRSVPKGPRTVLAMVRNGLLRVPLSIETNAQDVEALMTRFSSVPMSLADACLVRLVELMPDASVFTFDSDFTIYRTRKNRPIQLVDY